MSGTWNCSWSTSRKIRESGLFGLLKSSWKASGQFTPLSEKPDGCSPSCMLLPVLDATGRGWWGMERAGARGPNCWLGHLRVALSW